MAPGYGETNIWVQYGMIFDKHFYILRRKSTHIYDKMYNFITLKKKKKKKKTLFRSGGFLRSVGRGQSNNFFFWALSSNTPHGTVTCFCGEHEQLQIIDRSDRDIPGVLLMAGQWLYQCLSWWTCARIISCGTITLFCGKWRSTITGGSGKNIPGVF